MYWGEIVGHIVERKAFHLRQGGDSHRVPSMMALVENFVKDYRV